MNTGKGREKTWTYTSFIFLSAKITYTCISLKPTNQQWRNIVQR